MLGPGNGHHGYTENEDLGEAVLVVSSLGDSNGEHTTALASCSEVRPGAGVTLADRDGCLAADFTGFGHPVSRWGQNTKDATEACFEHELAVEPEGTVPVAIVNRPLGLGVYQVFRIAQLPFHTVWRMMGEDTYGVALEPGTNRDAGRWDAKERGELGYLEPGESRTYDLEIGALADQSSVEQFARRIDRLGAPPSLPRFVETARLP